MGVLALTASCSLRQHRPDGPGRYCIHAHAILEGLEIAIHDEQGPSSLVRGLAMADLKGSSSSLAVRDPDDRLDRMMQEEVVQVVPADKTDQNGQAIRQPARLAGLPSAPGTGSHTKPMTVNSTWPEPGRC